MKKYIIAVVFMLGIMPSFDGDINCLFDLKAQMLGIETEEKIECIDNGEIFCSYCGACYSDRSLSECPVCHDKGSGDGEGESQSSTTQCLRCYAIYKIGEKHTCRECMRCGWHCGLSHECPICPRCGRIQSVTHYCNY